MISCPTEGEASFLKGGGQAPSLHQARGAAAPLTNPYVARLIFMFTLCIVVQMYTLGSWRICTAYGYSGRYTETRRYGRTQVNLKFKFLYNKIFIQLCIVHIGQSWKCINLNRKIGTNLRTNINGDFKESLKLLLEKGARSAIQA